MLLLLLLLLLLLTLMMCGGWQLLFQHPTVDCRRRWRFYRVTVCDVGLEIAL